MARVLLVACLLAVAAAGAAADCSLPCSCAFGVEFGESVCGYANTTLDVAAVQDLMSAAQPDFAAALKIYNNGSFAYGANGVTKRTMYGVAHRNYGQEAYYKAAAAYFKQEFYLDSIMGAALRGDGDYASACCGMRAEVAKAGTRWFSAVYSLHEVNFGMCLTTGCNNRTISLELGAEEILHGMALMSGADPTNSDAGTSQAANLFQATNAASRFYCTMKKKDALAPINQAAIAAWQAASAAAKAGDVAALSSQYAALEKTVVARFLQFSLREAREASKAAGRRVLRKADACRAGCLREAQQAAARTYFRAAEPIIARTSPDLVAQINTLLSGAPRKSYKPLVKSYKAVAEALDLDVKTMLIKCKAS